MRNNLTTDAKKSTKAHVGLSPDHINGNGKQQFGNLSLDCPNMNYLTVILEAASSVVVTAKRQTAKPPGRKATSS
jgi:hypothetical protein